MKLKRNQNVCVCLCTLFLFEEARESRTFWPFHGAREELLDDGDDEKVWEVFEV
jgi:hypothetical protein